MTYSEHLHERRYDWRRSDQWGNLNARGYEGNATKDYFHTVATSIKQLYKEHRMDGVDYLHIEINDWRYLLLACQLIDDDYEKYKEA